MDFSHAARMEMSEGGSTGHAQGTCAGIQEVLEAVPGETGEELEVSANYKNEKGRSRCTRLLGRKSGRQRERERTQ